MTTETTTATHKLPMTTFEVRSQYPDLDTQEIKVHTYTTFATSENEIREEWTQNHAKNGPNARGYAAAELLSVLPKKPNTKQSKRLEAINELREMLEPGMRLQTVLRHVSSSGMSRHIDVYVFTCENGKVEKRYLSGFAARANEDRQAKDGSIVVGGCGMDMGFSIVYNLSRALYPHGFTCLGVDPKTGRRDCPSNDHSNRENRAEHRDGGYALTQEWL